MSRFEESADRVLEAIGGGANLRESCQKAAVPYATARTWVSAGRRDPSGKYGAWVRRLDAAKAGAAADADAEALVGNPSAPGPVESRLQSLVAGRELAGEAALAFAQAKTLAHTIDRLADTPGAAAATALASCSRRLEEVVPALALPRDDALTRLRARRSSRLDQQGNGGPNGEATGTPGRVDQIRREVAEERAARGAPNPGVW
jgi:hypothetical protein